MLNKLMNFISRLSTQYRKFVFSKSEIQIWLLIRGMKVIKNAKFQLNISKITPARQFLTIIIYNGKILRKDLPCQFIFCCDLIKNVP